MYVSSTSLGIIGQRKSYQNKVYLTLTSKTISSQGESCVTQTPETARWVLTLLTAWWVRAFILICNIQLLCHFDWGDFIWPELPLNKQLSPTPLPIVILSEHSNISFLRSPEQIHQKHPSFHLLGPSFTLVQSLSISSRWVVPTIFQESTTLFIRSLVSSDVALSKSSMSSAQDR